ncbi:N-acetyltransferase [Legionella israelensis]|uniref:N-acetyltransferase n=1 Tax=Legionella israelensis TaxID=454 RepID=A0AAX1EHH6_9GAMM|nr:GNAT family N-acetyltransferase [Legionella israelensis]QBR84565.1 N-acetyltransferase [Legionella israelensis]
MEKNYKIERMSKEEVEMVFHWAASEGWNPGLHDADCFYQTDPSGFFAGKLDGEIIAVGSAVVYDAEFAFCGFYIVAPGFRHQGYGMALTEARLNYIGERNAGIDAVAPMLKKYERLGYQIAHNNARYTSPAAFFQNVDQTGIVLLTEIDFSRLVEYDAQHFPARRDTFLRCWIHQPNSLSIGYINNNELKGYGVIRPCQQGFKIGPLFADSAEIADLLFRHLANFAQGEIIYLDIPENNSNAKILVKHYKMEKVFETARMYLKGEPKLPIEHIYGITSFELG